MAARIVRIMPLPPANAPHAERRGDSGGNFALLANVSVAKNSGNSPRLFAPPVRYENLIGVWDFIRFPILK